MKYKKKEYRGACTYSASRDVVQKRSENAFAVQDTQKRDDMKDKILKLIIMSYNISPAILMRESIFDKKDVKAVQSINVRAVLNEKNKDYIPECFQDAFPEMPGEDININNYREIFLEKIRDNLRDLVYNDCVTEAHQIYDMFYGHDDYSEMEAIYKNIRKDYNKGQGYVKTQAIRDSESL